MFKPCVLYVIYVKHSARQIYRGVLLDHVISFLLLELRKVHVHTENVQTHTKIA